MLHVVVGPDLFRENTLLLKEKTLITKEMRLTGIERARVFFKHMLNY
jgi:hypothetical protein